MAGPSPDWRNLLPLLLQVVPVATLQLPRLTQAHLLRPLQLLVVPLLLQLLVPLILLLVLLPLVAPVVKVVFPRLPLLPLAARVLLPLPAQRICWALSLFPSSGVAVRKKLPLLPPESLIKVLPTKLLSR